MSSKDNRIKAINGRETRKKIESVVTELHSDGIITERQRKVPFFRAGFPNSKYVAPILIKLPDGSKTAVFTTHSIRTDRVKEQQWEALNIKEIDPTISTAWIVVPDEGAMAQGMKLKANIKNKSVYSMIDDILTADEFDYILRSQYKVYASVEYLEDIEDTESDEVSESFVPEAESSVAGAFAPGLLERISRGYEIEAEEIDGAARDWQGRKFEDVYAAILDDESNLQIYNSGDESLSEEGFFYNVFAETMHAVDISPGEAKRIFATSVIPKLENGGNPKTDVRAIVDVGRKEERQLTFSLKSSAKRIVSVHEYSAEAFAKILDPSNVRLKTLLERFQEAGCKQGMSEREVQELTNLLMPYHDRLNEWVYSGDPKLRGCAQYADYLVLHDKTADMVTVNSCRQHWRKLESDDASSGMFGTIFGWTYPSKKRGARIQLKGRVK